MSNKTITITHAQLREAIQEGSKELREYVTQMIVQNETLCGKLLEAKQRIDTLESCEVDAKRYRWLRENDFTAEYSKYTDWRLNDPKAMPENQLDEMIDVHSAAQPTTDIPDEREDPCHPDYVGDLELPQPKKPAYTLEQMQNDILHDVADLADEAGMDEVAEELREQAGEDSRQPTGGAPNG